MKYVVIILFEVEAKLLLDCSIVALIYNSFI